MNPDDKPLVRALLMLVAAFAIVTIGVIAITFAAGPTPQPSPTGTTEVGS